MTKSESARIYIVAQILASVVISHHGMMLVADIPVKATEQTIIVVLAVKVSV